MVKVLYLLAILLLRPCIAHAKRVTPPDSSMYYINVKGYFVRERDSAAIIRIVTDPKQGEKLYSVHDRYPNGKIKLITHSIDATGAGFMGACTEYYPDGLKKSEENYQNDELRGRYIGYYANGRKYISGYIQPTGTFIIQECYDKEGNVLATDGNGELIDYNEDRTEIIGRGTILNGIKDGSWKYYEKGKVLTTQYFKNGEYVAAPTANPYPTPDQSAEFTKGGTNAFSQFVADRIYISDEVKRNKVRGRIYVSFVVEKDGSISNIKVIRGLGYGLNEKVIKAVEGSSKLWKPAKLHGEPIASLYTLPISLEYN